MELTDAGEEFRNVGQFCPSWADGNVVVLLKKKKKRIKCEK